MTRHYCYVPGRGAYMLVDEPSSQSNGIGIDSNHLHVICAPKRIVRFSPLHAHDDGMLANLLMEAEGMTYDDACRYIDRQAALLSEDFAESASLHTDTQNFGFDILHLEKWADIESRISQNDHVENERVSKSKHDEIVAIPKYWLKRTAVALLIGVFFFTNFIGLNRGSANKAGVIDVNAIQHNGLVHQSWDDEDELIDLAEQETLSAEENILIESAIDDAIVETTILRHPELVATVPVSPVDLIDEDPIQAVATGTTYFIIVGCSTYENVATSIFNRYRERGFENVGILVTRDLFRVFIGQFSEKDEAIAYLRSIRNMNGNQIKSWMLPFENDGSLSSYIIKKIYNDNQLSMELSHPHQRTERDQG